MRNDARPQKMRELSIVDLKRSESLRKVRFRVQYRGAANITKECAETRQMFRRPGTRALFAGYRRVRARRGLPAR
jgi:hypothetical protein